MYNTIHSVHCHFQKLLVCMLLVRECLELEKSPSVSLFVSRRENNMPTIHIFIFILFSVFDDGRSDMANVDSPAHNSTVGSGDRLFDD